MSDLCLIIPPSPFLMDERVFPFLGVLKVASSALADGVNVEVLDLSGVENYSDILLQYIKLRTPDLFGITCTTAQYPYAAELGLIIQQTCQVPVAVGGPHPTVTHAAIKTAGKGLDRAKMAMKSLLDIFDIVVAGDGEVAIRELMASDLHRREQALVVDADEPKGGLFLDKKELDNWPIPERKLLDLSTYNYDIDGKRATSLISQLGCPFNCQFCCGRSSAMLRRARMRSSDSVMSEVRHLYETYGYTGYMFYDDELNVNKDLTGLMEKLYDYQQSIGEAFALRGFLKSELFTARQAEVMARAGFSWILIGFEAGSERILKNINKRATRDDNSKAIATAKRFGIKTKALMSVGHPGESLETVAASKEWLLEAQPEDFDVSIITPYPGSPYYDESEYDQGIWKYTAKSGDILYSEHVDYQSTADYYKGDSKGTKTSVNVEGTDLLATRRVYNRIQA